MTTELIKINLDDDGRQTVLGRELHAGLEVGTAYDVWFKRMIEYGFEEGKDYSSILMDRSDNLPGKPRTDHVLSLDMAKHLSMIQRTEKGKRIREYFIECERRLIESLKTQAHSESVEAEKKPTFMDLDVGPWIPGSAKTAKEEGLQVLAFVQHICQGGR